MSERETMLQLRDLRAHAEDKHRPNPVMVTMTTRQALALVEVAEAAHGIYGVPQTFLSGHGESDEITCYCGFQSQAGDYEKARKALEQHIYRAEKKILDSAAAKHKRLDAALAVFDWTAE